ncbi:Zinc finger, CCHC-type [Sesbania bispinosa]|nr:Zinc finger, CCHC-type [Sesbania bispinosa]
MELRDTNVKMEDEDAAMIRLSFLRPSHENFYEFSLYRIGLYHTRKSQKEKRKEKGKKGKVDPNDICNYCKEPGHWKKDCPTKRNTYFVATTVQYGTS